jgi:polar amino acid transport system permease protein
MAAAAPGYVFDFHSIVDNLPQLAHGLGLTLLASALGIVLATLIGLFLGSARAYRIPLLRSIGSGYVAAFRGTPILVQIFFLYYALPDIGIRLSVFQVAVLSLALWGGSYNTENFRAAFMAVPQGAMQAASALGMPPAHRYAWIAIPLATRIALPSLINTSISILKDSAYLSVIAYAELTYVAMNIVANDFRVFEMFAVLGVTYLGIVLLLSALLNRVRLQLARRGTVGDH